jgi:hypothetical protein
MTAHGLSRREYFKGSLNQNKLTVYSWRQANGLFYMLFRILYLMGVLNRKIARKYINL